jgi:hypothetical protein
VSAIAVEAAGGRARHATAREGPGAGGSTGSSHPARWEKSVDLPVRHGGPRRALGVAVEAHLCHPRNTPIPTHISPSRGHLSEVVALAACVERHGWGESRRDRSMCVCDVRYGLHVGAAVSASGQTQGSSSHQAETHALCARALKRIGGGHACAGNRSCAAGGLRATATAPAATNPPFRSTRRRYGHCQQPWRSALCGFICVGIAPPSAGARCRPWRVQATQDRSCALPAFRGSAGGCGSGTLLSVDFARIFLNRQSRSSSCWPAITNVFRDLD